jgi:hypothetical protein
MADMLPQSPHVCCLGKNGPSSGESPSAKAARDGDNGGQSSSKFIDFVGVSRRVTTFGTQGSKVFSGSRCDVPPQRNNLRFLSQVQYRKIRPNGLCDVARRQMRIVLLCHAGIGMAELGCNHPHRDPGHGEMRAVGMTQDMEGHGGFNPRSFARLIQRPLLVGRAPTVIVSAQEYVISRTQILSPLRKGPVCTENLNPDVVMVKPAEDRV